MQTKKARRNKKDKLILASASPRRKKLLKKAGFKFRIVVPKVTEISFKNNPRKTVIENAKKKGMWCLKKYPHAWIIAADTTVAFHGKCIPKPRDIAEAKKFLSAFSGKKQFVYTGIFIAPPKGKPVIRAVKSIVTFKQISPKTIDAYFKKVNPLDKAGAYDINQSSKKIIQSYKGSYSNIMGLPMETIINILRKKGFRKC